MTDRLDPNDEDGARRQAEGRRRPRLANRATIGVALTFLPAFGLLGAEAKAEPIKVKNKRSHGKGSLLAAVKRANKDADRDKITFRSRLSGEIRLRDGLVVTKPVRIDGAGARRLEIVGPRLGRTVELETGSSKASRIAHLRLSRLGIDAFSPPNFSPSLELFDSTLSGDGSRRLDGVRAYGVDLDIRGTKIRGFESAGVDAGYLSGKIKNSAISGSGGPGIDVFHAGLAVGGSAVLNNGGPGVSVFYYAGASVTNSTISGNGTDPQASAGGVSSVYASVVRINSSTVNGKGKGADGGVFSTYDGSILLHNSIVAGGACGDGTSDGTSLESGGGNVIENVNGCSGLQDSDVVGDPLLGRFAKHGGRTPSHSLRRGSPAIGNATKPFATTDQRGVRRDRNPDSGSFERR